MSGKDPWVVLHPHDTLHIRDGRSFTSGSGESAETVRPVPSTVGGAVAASYGGDQEEIRGPVLMRGSATGWEPYYPVPSDLSVSRVSEEPEVWRARPRPTVAHTDLSVPDSGIDHPPLQLLSEPEGADSPEPLDGWLPSTVLERYLHGTLLADDSSVAVTELDLAEPEPLVVEERVGLARTPQRTARTHHLYRSTHLRPHDGWAFGAQVQRHPDRPRTPASPVRFGGVGRLADITEVAGVDWPAPPDDFPGGRVLVYVATPALWGQGWYPPIPPEATLVSASVRTPLPVSTASPARGNRHFRDSRALYWAVPAGSVYLLSFAEGAAEWAHQFHGRALTPAFRPRLGTAGFGVVLTGVWS